MSTSSNSSSSLSGSTSNPQDSSGRTFTPFTGQFGSMVPIYNPDGTIKAAYDVEDKFYISTSNRGSRISMPALVTASTSQVPPPSSMGNIAGGVSVSRSLNFNRGIPSQGILQQQGSPQAYSMPASSYPTAGGHSQTHVQAMSSQSSMSFMSGMNSNYTSALQFGSNAGYQMDLQSQQSSMGRHGGFYLGGAYTSHFPQLQKAQAVSSSGVSSQTGGPPSIGSTSVNAAMGYDLPTLQHHQNTSQQNLPAIGQPIRDMGSKPKQAVPQSNPDPFRMLSLLNVINNTKPDATTLALGIDLTDIGLDMLSKESLFKTFASPWANEPLKGDPNEFTLPQCYNAEQRPPPHQGMYRTFKLDTLFYIFYSMPKDEAQLYAADELYNRGWFYHIKLKCWFLRIGEPLVKTHAYERGTYYCFDPEIFETVQKNNIVLFYEMLEERASLLQHRM